MILRLCRVELLKLRRSLIILMTVVCPLAVVALVFGANLHNANPNSVTPDKWNLLWNSVSAMWSWFMLPLFIALSASLINGNEHRNQGWRFMLTLPILPFELYSAKFIIIAFLVVISQVAMLSFTVLGIGVLGLLGFSLTGAFTINPTQMLWAAPVASLPLLVLQHAMSWRIKSFTPPLAIAVVATFASIQLGRSDFWRFVPWAYPMISTNSASAAARLDAVILGLCLAAILFPVTAYWLTRRDID